MGCWGFGIMESDDALDHEYNLHSVAGIDHHADGYDPSSADTRAKLERNMEPMLELLRKIEPKQNLSFQRAVGYQVLATTLMGAGATIPEAAHQEIAKGILGCEEYRFAKMAQQESAGPIKTEVLKALGMKSEGPWGLGDTAKRFDGRLAALNELVESLRAYDCAGGTPKQGTSKGLFEAIADKLNV